MTSSDYENLVANVLGRWDQSDSYSVADACRDLAAIRAAALEEAAQAVIHYDTSVCDTGWGPSKDDFVEAIRALKT